MRGRVGAAGGAVEASCQWHPHYGCTGSTRQYPAVPHLDALVGAAEGLGKGAQLVLQQWTTPEGGSQAVSGRRCRCVCAPLQCSMQAGRQVGGAKQNRAAAGGMPEPARAGSERSSAAHRCAHGDAVGEGPADVHDCKVAAQALLQAMAG